MPISILSGLIAIVLFFLLCYFSFSLITELNHTKALKGNKQAKAKQMFVKCVVKTVVCLLAWFSAIFVCVKTSYPTVESEKLLSEYDAISSYTYAINEIEYTVSEENLYIKEGTVYQRDNVLEGLNLNYTFSEITLPGDAVMVAIEY